MHKLSLDEQTAYQSSFRIFLNKQNVVKFYTRNQSICVKEIATFDAKAAMLSSLELFVASFASSCILAIKKEAKKEKILLEDMEARFTCNLKNPLELLDVIGYDDAAAITTLKGDLYIYSECDEKRVCDLCHTALKKSLIYALLNDQITIDIQPKIIHI